MKIHRITVGLAFVIALLLLSSISSLTLAQYQTQKSTPVTLSSSGVAHVAENSTVGGISIDIAGAPNATGSVSTATYTADPQPTASIPANVTLSHFVVVSFNFTASDFLGANITISTVGEVAGIAPPYALYKYIAANNSYVALPSTYDATAKTITAHVSSINDPLFAIGGTTAIATATPTASPTVTPTPPSVSLYTWGIVVIIIEVIILVTIIVMGYHYRRKPSSATL